MRYYKRILAVVLLLLILSTAVSAAGSIALDRDLGLTITYQDGDVPLAGAAFRIYLVASVDANGELTTTDPFRQFNVDIRGKNDEAWKTLAATLEGYALRDGIAPTDSGETDAAGCLSFPTGGERLTPGLYLVLGDRCTHDGFRYDAAPFMVMLPTQDTEKNAWVYDVLVDPKYVSSAIPDTPTTVDREVQKVWDDADRKNSRPSEVTVQLLCDGELYDSATLNAENNWRYIWTDLDDSHSWTVVEKECEGYTVQVEQNGSRFVITNTPLGGTPDKPSPAEPTLPQTGQLWWPVPLLLMGGSLFLLIGLVCRKRRKA